MSNWASEFHCSVSHLTYSFPHPESVQTHISLGYKTFFIHFLKWLLFLPLLSSPTWLASTQECWSFPGLWHKIAVLLDLTREGKSSTYVYDLLKGVGILKHSKFQRQIFRTRVKEKKQASWSVCSAHGYSISSLSGWQYLKRKTPIWDWVFLFLHAPGNNGII